jgi:hypothetical protein
MDNQTLITFLSLKEQIATLEKQLAPIRKEIEAAGSLETDAFVVKVDEVTQNRVVGCDELLEKVGFVKVNELGLIRESTYNKVTVKQKLQKIG